MSLRLCSGRSALTLAVVAVLAGCAPLQPELPRVGRAQLELPAGPWEPLGQTGDVIDVLPDDTSHDLPVETVALGLRGADRQLLAVLLVQTNSTNYPRDTTLWTVPCTPQKGVHVEDAAKASPVRIDCLRYKRRADTEGYMEQSRPAVAQWMARYKAEPAKPYSHVSYRYATTGGAYVSVDAVVDQRLLRPDTRNNEEFLRAGRPALEWGDKLAQAVRVSAGMMDGRLVIPAFPIAPPQ